MVAEIQQKLDASAAISIKPAAIANNAIRMSLAITNPDQRPGALIYCRISVGTAPTAGGTIVIYLLRKNNAGYFDDNWGGIDATVIPTGGEMQAAVIGTIFVPVVTDNLQYTKVIDTLEASAGVIGVEWGIAIENKTGVALRAGDANHVCEFTYDLPEIQ